jgi:voltage-gated potassium channel
MNKDIRKKLIKAVTAVVAILLIGIVGFRFLLKDLTWVDAAYLTVVTIGTVGYGDLSAQNNRYSDVRGDIGKIFTIFLIVAGMGTFVYPVGIIAEYMISGQMRREARKRKMQRLISRVSNHFIICGGGETGTHVLAELEKTMRPYVLIEKSEQRIDELQERFKGLIFVEGDATDENNILAAGLDRAAGILCALPDEKDNLLVVISTSQAKKEKGEAFRVVAKVTDFDKTSPKLRAAGADIVISPNSISGRRMVSEMFRPAVTTFLDRMLRDSRAVMRTEEATISHHSPLKGATLATAKIPQKTGLVIVALKKKGEPQFILNPRASQQLGEGDTLIAVGDMRNIVKLRHLAGGHAA